MNSLPSLQLSSIDVETLEVHNWSLGSKYVKKAVKNEPSPSVEKKKKKKKRKKILPKSYDPSVDPDPERWVPRWQRAGFKRSKKDKKSGAVGKGTQGSVSTNEKYDWF